jgi:hypothetical protein
MRKIPVTVNFDKQRVIGMLELSDDAIISLDSVIAFALLATRTTSDGKPTDLKVVEASLLPERMYPFPSKQTSLNDTFYKMARMLLAYLDEYNENIDIANDALNTQNNMAFAILSSFGHVWFSPVHQRMVLSIKQPGGSTFNIVNYR